MNTGQEKDQTTTAGTAFSEAESDRRFCGPQEDVMEAWGPVSALADAIDDACADGIARTIAEEPQGGFHENAMTTDILLNVAARIDGQKIEFHSGYKRLLNVGLYKRSGRSETAFGDIAVVFSCYGADYSFIGVASIEAKRRDSRSKTFKSIEELQLLRILQNEPHALLALYETDSLTKYQDTVHVGKRDERVAILPMQQVAKEVNKLEIMRSLSTTLGHQVAVRFLNGADLRLVDDLADAAIASAKASFIVVVASGREKELDTVLSNPIFAQVLSKFENLEEAVMRVKNSRDRGRGR